MRRAWPVAAGLLLGLLAGLLWTLAQPDGYRAEARLSVRGSAEGVVPAVEALAESSLLEQNVAQTLRLARPPEVGAEADDDGVLTLTVEASSSERARQRDAEAVQVLTQLVAARFENTPVELTLLDPAHTVEQTSPTPARNLLIGGVVGLVLGVTAAAGLANRRRLPSVPVVHDPAFERRLHARVEAVAKRERALARRAGELAVREKQLARREKDLEAAAAGRSQAPQPERGPESGVPLPREPVVRTAVTAGGNWSIHDLERAVDSRSDASPEQVEEWRTYLYFLREHASVDGTLPSAFEPLILDVFAEVVDVGSA